MALLAQALRLSQTVAMQPLDTVTLRKGAAWLCREEPRFRAVLNRHGLPSLRATAGGLPALLAIVTEQFLSLQAAAAIWQRVSQRLAPMDSATILRCSTGELLSLGLSRAKAKSFHGIAEAVSGGTCTFSEIAALDDLAAAKYLCRLPGVGPWTADIYLLSAELRPDVWPWGDLALQIAAQNLLALSERPDRTAMQAVGLRFSPWRAVAARLLWSHYRDLKQLPQA